MCTTGYCLHDRLASGVLAMLLAHPAARGCKFVAEDRGSVMWLSIVASDAGSVHMGRPHTGPWLHTRRDEARVAPLPPQATSWTNITADSQGRWCSWRISHTRS